MLEPSAASSCSRPGIDENPFAYKDIEEVMARQTSLVDVVGRFDPRIVRMAEAGERPED